MKFSDIKGHDDVKRRLRDMADSDRIPHALLLEGEEGIGKLQMALTFAQYVHCEHRAGGEPCGKCPSCLQHQSNNHPDLFYAFPIFKKASETVFCDEYITEWNEFLAHSRFHSFEDWLGFLNPGTKQPVIYNSEGSQIIHKISVKSYSSRYKIMIMWLPEKMKEECANRLLKMIEEPYENTVLLFVSNKPNEILPTIYSRIQRVGMKRLSDSLVAECLTQSLAVDSQTAMSFAALSEGSVTKAMGLMDSAADNAMFLDMFKQLTRMAYLRDVRGLKVWSEEAADMKREKNVLFLTYLSRLFRENFIYNIGNRSLNYLTPQEEQFSAKFCPFVNERNVEAIENETARATSDIARNANAKIVMFDYAVKMVVALRM